MSVLQQAKTSTQSLLKKISTDAQKFTEIIDTAFGNNYDTLAFNQILAKWQNSDFSNLPTIKKSK